MPTSLRDLLLSMLLGNGILIKHHQLTQCKDFLAKLSEEKVYSHSSLKNVVEESPVQGGTANLL